MQPSILLRSTVLWGALKESACPSAAALPAARWPVNPLPCGQVAALTDPRAAALLEGAHSQSMSSSSEQYAASCLGGVSFIACYVALPALSWLHYLRQE